MGEVDEKGFHIFKTRLGRWKNDSMGIKPICIMTCNPTKNWLYREYYTPFTEGTLKPYQMFIQALPTDNKHITQSYIDELDKLPLIERERLRHGNWNYDDDANSLMSYDEILGVWDGMPIRELDDYKASEKYITADIAFTSDKMVLLVWYGLMIVDIRVNPKGNTEDAIMSLASEHNVPQYNIAYDSDGVGKFLGSRLRNAKAILNNGKPLRGENYKNLKTQLHFKLAEMISNNEVKISIHNNKKEIIEELQTLRHKPSSVVGKLEMISKAEQKRILGRSPDFSDAMAYRMLFEYKVTGVRPFRIG